MAKSVNIAFVITLLYSIFVVLTSLNQPQTLSVKYIYDTLHLEAYILGGIWDDLL